MFAGKVTFDNVPVTEPVQFKFPVPRPFTAIDPSAAPQIDGFVRVPAEITGVGFTVTVIEEDIGEVQPVTVVVTLYVPELVTVIACVVSPSDQVSPELADEVNTTEPPWQNVVAPPAEIVGAPGIGLTVITITEDAGDVQPEAVVVTVYVPEFVTVIACVVSPSDQVFPELADEVNTTEPP